MASVAAIRWRVLAPERPEMFEAHFGVPMAGAVLNTHQHPPRCPTIAFILNHGEAKVLITDREFSPAPGSAPAGRGTRRW